MPTNHPSFLARKTLGQPNYLLIAVAAVFAIALTPWGAYRAVESRSNNLDAWLPAAQESVANLAWFRDQFDGDQFVLVSWDGCTLAEAGKLQRVARKLAPSVAVGEFTEAAAPVAEQPLFTRVATGPDVLSQLMAAPYNLNRAVAIGRLQGALIGPETAGTGGQLARTTCLAAYLSPAASDNEAVRRQAIETIRTVVAAEAHVDPAAIRMVGPGIDAIAINDESERTLVRWGAAAAAIGFVVACWRLKSAALAAMVTAVGVVSAVACVSLVFYFGVFEVLTLERVAPVLGRGDAVVLSAAVLAYLLGTLAAMRLVYYYRDSRLNGLREGAAEQAVMDAWPHVAIVGLLIAACLGALCVSDLLPARRFGLFAGLGALASVAAALAIVPVLLHRFPLAEGVMAALGGPERKAQAPGWLLGLFEASTAAPLAIATLGIAAMCGLGWGVSRLDMGPRLPAMVGSRSQLLQDYQWFDRNVGNAAPLEVVLTVPIERCREANEAAEGDGQQYRLTLEERMRLMQDIERGMHDMPEVSAILSPATAMPASETLANNEPAVREALERHGYVRAEHQPGTARPSGRELWRMSARVAASTPEQGDVDYAKVVSRTRAIVKPVLMAYEQRDFLVRALHQSGKQLAGAKVAVLFRGSDVTAPTPNSQEEFVAELLRRSGVAGGEVALVNLASLEGSDRAGLAMQERARALLTEQDAALVVSGEQDAAIEKLIAQGIHVVQAVDLPGVEETKLKELLQAGGPRPIRAVFTGMPPVAETAHLDLAGTLRTAAMYVIPGLALAMMFVARNAVGGVLSLISILFPVAVVIGSLGWAGINVDLGVLLLGAAALAVAIDGTVNFLAWYRYGADAGMFRTEAARLAFARIAPGMLDTTLVCGVGMLALGLSGIAFAQQFGLLALPLMAAAGAGCLIVLPAVASTPLGRFFGAEAAPASGDFAVAPVRVSETPGGDAASPTGRADAASAGVPAGPHRTRPTVVGEERQDMVDGPHAALHAKLQQLRRPTGDSPTP